MCKADMPLITIETISMEEYLVRLDSLTVFWIFTRFEKQKKVRITAK